MSNSGKWRKILIALGVLCCGTTIQSCTSMRSYSITRSPLTSHLEPGDVGQVTGLVVNENDQSPVEGAAIRIAGTTLGCFTDSDGWYIVPRVLPGEHQIQVSLAGYAPILTKDFEVNAFERLWIDFQLTEIAVSDGVLDSIKNQPAIEFVGPVSIRKLPQYSTNHKFGEINGFILNAESHQPTIGAAVALKGTPLGALTDVDGWFRVLSVPPGMYSVEARLVGHPTKAIDSVEVRAGGMTRIYLNLSASKIRPVAPDFIGGGIQPQR